MGDISMSYDGIIAAANKLQGAIAQQASETNSRFRTLKLAPGALGPTPVAHRFVAQHEAAHQLFEETIEQVRRDLDGFGDALKASVETAKNVDETAEQALAKLDPSAIQLRADAAYAAGVEEKVSALAVDTTTVEAGRQADAAAAQPDPAPATADTPVITPTPPVRTGAQLE